MKEIPALALIVLWGPAGLSKPATIAMPHIQQTEANSMSFLLPT
jgi:hypothetical protein